MPTQSERLSLEPEMLPAMCLLNSWDKAKIKTEYFCCFYLLFLVYFMQEKKGYILHNSYRANILSTVLHLIIYTVLSLALSSASPGSLLEMHVLRPGPYLLGQNLETESI